MASIGRYRKIETRIWNDAKFHGLDDKGKLAFFLVLTHPHMTALGAMRATVGGLADELKWPNDAMRHAIRDAMSLGLVEMDEKACYLGLPNFLKYNEPEGPNSVVKAWPQALELIPECAFKVKLIARCRSYLEARSPEFRQAMGDAILDAFKTPCPIQEPEPEPEHEQELKTKARRASVNEQSLPEWVPMEQWEGFVEMRRAKKAPLTGRALTLAVRTLEQLRSNGEDVTAVLDQSTMQGWKGLFPVKANGNHTQNGATNGNRAVMREQQNKSAIAAGVEAAADEILGREDELGSQSIRPSNTHTRISEKHQSRVV